MVKAEKWPLEHFVWNAAHIHQKRLNCVLMKAARFISIGLQDNSKPALIGVSPFSKALSYETLY